MNSNEKPRLNSNGILFASGLGVVIGGLTLMIQRLTTIKTLIILLLPGIFGAMAISGNVHSFPLWLAAAINAMIYFGIGWLLYVLGAKYRRRED
jgi:prepilin signal peptidase PulO-like enzyme (type II secretory pathway)